MISTAITKGAEMAGVAPIAGHPARRLCIMLTRCDHFHHHSLMVTLLSRARRAGLAGATAIEAVVGYGTSRQIHHRHAIFDDVPVTIVIIDRPELIESFIEGVEDLLADVAFMISDVEVIDF
jgi:PII-like signaling protein